MASRDELMAALRKADEAGDTEGAHRFAEMIRTLPKPKTVVERAKPRTWREFNDQTLRAINAVPDAVAHGLTAGLSDVAGAYAGAAGRYVGDVAAHKKPSFSRAYTATQADISRGQKENPKATAIGQFAGGMVSPINKIGVGGNALMRVLAPAATYGLVEGASGSHGSIMERAEQTGESVLGSLVGAGAGHRVGKTVGKVLAPKFSAAAQRLMDKGVRLTPGQLAGGKAATAEGLLAKMPGVGALVRHGQYQSMLDWNRSMYQHVLDNVGIKHNGAVGHEAMVHVEDSLSKEYDKLLPKAVLHPDKALENDWTTLKRDISELPPDMQKQVRTILGNRFFNRDTRQPISLDPNNRRVRSISGAEFKQIESVLATKAREFQGNADSDKRAISRILNDWNAALRANLERSNPGMREELKKVNTGWAQMKRLQSAVQARVDTGGIFTPQDFLRATRKLDRSTGHRMTARGEALLQRQGKDAMKVIGADAGKFRSTDAVGAVIEGQQFGQYARQHPLMATGIGAAGMAYTRPGMTLINAMAKKTPGKARNMVSRLLTEKGGTAGAVSGAELAQIFNNRGGQ